MTAHDWHGEYNGWCRVQGIPLRAADCPGCQATAAAVAVTRRLLDDWIPDTERMGWWHMGSGMEGPGQPMTEPEAAWLAHVEAVTA